MQPFEQAWTLLKQAVFPGTAQWEQQQNDPYIPEAHIDIPKDRLHAAQWEKNKRMREGGDYTEERDRYNRVRDENTFTVPGDPVAWANRPTKTDRVTNPGRARREGSQPVPEQRVHYQRQRSDMTHPKQARRDPDTGEIEYSRRLDLAGNPMPKPDNSLLPTIDESHGTIQIGRGLTTGGRPARNPNVPVPFDWRDPYFGTPQGPRDFMDASNRAAQAEWRGDDAAL